MEEQISSRYIQQISPNMFFELMEFFDSCYDGIVCNEFQLIREDIGFMKLFLKLCLERWDLNASDEQSREILRSILTSFKVIWLAFLEEGEDEGEDEREEGEDEGGEEGEEGEDEGEEVLDWPSLKSELEGRIHQTKLLIEGWCVILLPKNSSLLQCKPSSIHDVHDFLRDLRDLLLSVLLRQRDAGISPFEYFRILINNIDFLFHLSSIFTEYSTESIDFLNFVNFASAFSNKAACFTCLSWAKEVNVNLLLFAMTHEFIPSAPDVIACYFRILPLTNLHSNLHSVLIRETIPSFVGYIFGYLEITLMEEFPILIDRLIYLFTFISDQPHENAEKEDLIIRSQIYALLREDVYPLLSFHEMKEDLSNNNNIILRDFMIKIDIANAKLRQRYYVFSYSWIGSEAVKMDYYYFVSVKGTLIKHIQPSSRYDQQQLQNKLLLYVMEIGFLRESLLWFEMLDTEIKSRLNLVIISLQRIWGREEQEKGFLAVGIHKMLNEQEWRPLAFELEGKIESSKIEISTQLVNGFDWSLQNKPSTSNRVLKFLDSILDNLNALLRYKASVILPFKKQIETLEDKLLFMQHIMKLVENCTDSKDLGEFIMFVHDFAKEAARLTILYWLKEANDKSATEISLILSHTLHKIKPATPYIARLYFETLKVLYLHQSNPFLFGYSATIFVDFLFEDSVSDFKDDFEILRDDVIFLLAFLNDIASENAEELIENTFWEDVYRILSIDDMKRDFSYKMVCLSGFMMKIETVNAKIRKLYCEFSDLSLYDLPKITSPWYLDFLIQNLRNLKERMITDHKFAPFVKYKIIKIEEELVSLSPFFNYIFKLQNELNDTWLQVVDLVHLTERVINSCISSWFVFDHPIWYYMSYLSHVFDKIKTVKKKLEKVKENNMHNACYLTRSAGVIGTRLKQEWSSEIDEVVMGLDGMAKKLINDLKGEHKSLDTVSIVGMGGLGKTTLARKVSLSVKDDFDVFAFCTVSQDHNTRMLLLGILKDIIRDDDRIFHMTNDDLAHKLWQCLSRQKFFIVLDDVWQTSVWNEVKRSLPDDGNRSRVMITTRFYDVANECKLKCSPFEMPFISDVESWELLQKKVFQTGISPPNLSNIGRRIAESCKGLPLAIVVIAGVLARIERSESSWIEIAEKVFSLLSEEGCMKILELSYSHLPEYLKPCILYLGAFPEDNLFRVNQITRLWIAEGFVHEYEAKSVEDVAKEYFQDLVNRSLVIVRSRSSDGLMIKTFNVHDLIHKMCQTKCQEGNFFKFGRGIAASSSMYDHYRISDLAVPPTVCGVSSSLENASTVLLFTDKAHQDSSLKKLKLVQVLHLNSKSKKSYMNFLTSLVNLRHVEYHSKYSHTWLPTSISNLWNIQSVILNGYLLSMPETLWKMKSLRHVKAGKFRLQFSDDHEREKLDKVISFSSPILYSGKEVECLLQRLPVVRKLGIGLSYPDDEDTLDFFRKLESLKIYTDYNAKSYLINFPSTLKKLSLYGLRLPFTCISSIAELKCLRVLKLRSNSFTGPTLEMEDVVFNHLVFFQLYSGELVQWNASIESFPCLEQLWIDCRKMEELPPCFGEISTLKRIRIFGSTITFGESVRRIGEELTDLGNNVEVTIDYKKKKIVIDMITVDNEKSRRKALKIAVSQAGVYSVVLKGDARNQIEVIVDQVAAVQLITMLRKKVGSADLISVETSNYSDWR